MNHIKRFLIIVGAAALGACATSEPAPTPAPAPAVVAAHTVVADPAAVAASATYKPPYGYEKEVLADGTLMYCHNDLDTNSRVKRTRVCQTEAQLKAAQDNTQSFMDDVQRHGVGSTMTGTPGAGH